MQIIRDLWYCAILLGKNGCPDAPLGPLWPLQTPFCCLQPGYNISIGTWTAYLCFGTFNTFYFKGWASAVTVFCHLVLVCGC